jgi:hypothetical protein
MNKEQAIKWGLIAVGLYLIYEYAQSHGGFKSLLGFAAGDSPGGSALPPATTFTAASSSSAPATTHAPATTAAATLDMTGLTVTRDVNDSLAGTVKINGVPIRLAIIQADGRIFDNAGQEVTSSLASQGINVDQIRAAFTAAGAGLGMFAPLGARFGSAYWLM